MIVFQINGIFGLATGFYKLPHRFEPIVSRSLKFGDFLVKIDTAIDQFTFFLFVFLQRQATF
ncbi:hypothetical protein COV83_06070 [Candidatus Peregrinibacteria bacterium CG11_big_fil_rev_8_21_14_0_20_49_14]|nr:MAG: hypothetical protein COV83_06070 [Candidatus Peregrinibacteria bacterium CG11_big_fil_rev_8_21_14_0_20_49_14]